VGTVASRPVAGAAPRIRRPWCQAGAKRGQSTAYHPHVHRPVIVAERIRGTRYWTLLEALAERVGLVAIESPLAGFCGTFVDVS